MIKTYNVVDMFCGAGGESTGIMQAAMKHDMKVNLLAETPRTKDVPGLPEGLPNPRQHFRAGEADRQRRAAWDGGSSCVGCDERVKIYISVLLKEE